MRLKAPTGIAQLAQGLSIRSEKFGNHDEIIFRGGRSPYDILICVKPITTISQFILTVWKRLLLEIILRSVAVNPCRDNSSS